MEDSPDRYHLFIDSGAWGLFRRHVQTAPRLAGNKLDYSFYDLKKGSKFREYCDGYAKFIRDMEGKIELFANVDVIGNPERTWEVRLFFEKEHELRLIPVVHHHGEPLSWVDRYLDRGYDLIGLGGMASGVGKRDIMRWCDRVFSHICPSSNGNLPIVRTHGFAITSPEVMSMFPWSSVDSTSWMKFAAYGGVFIPGWSSKRKQWDFNRRWRIPFSHQSPKKKDYGLHYRTLPSGPRSIVDRWLDRWAVTAEALEGEPDVPQQPFRDARAGMNVKYFNEFAKTLPKYPWPYFSQVQKGGDFGL